MRNAQLVRILLTSFDFGIYMHVCIYTDTDTNIMNKTREEENPKSGAVDQKSDKSSQFGGKSPQDLW